MRRDYTLDTPLAETWLSKRIKEQMAVRIETAAGTPVMLTSAQDPILKRVQSRPSTMRDLVEFSLTNRNALIRKPQIGARAIEEIDGALKRHNLIAALATELESKPEPETPPEPEPEEHMHAAADSADLVKAEDDVLTEREPIATLTIPAGQDIYAPGMFAATMAGKMRTGDVITIRHAGDTITLQHERLSVLVAQAREAYDDWGVD